MDGERWSGSGRSNCCVGQKLPNWLEGVPEELVWLRNLTQKKWAEPEHSSNNFMAKKYRGPEERRHRISQTIWGPIAAGPGP